VVAWWHAENNLADAFANNSGTELSPTGFVAGQLGQAFESPSVEVQSSPMLEFSGSITVETWVNTPEWRATGRIIDKITANSDDGYFMGMDGGFPCFGVGNQQVNGSYELPLGTWNHVAGVFDGTGMAIYVNGDLQGFVAHPAPLPVNKLPFRIGIDSDREFVFPGLIDETRVWHRALSASQIQAAWVAGWARAGMVSWWSGDGLNPFDDVLGHNPGATSGVTTTAGVVGSALHFAGDSTSQVQVAPSASLDFANNEMTVVAWINPTVLRGRIVDKITANVADGYLLDITDSKLRFLVGYLAVSSSTPPPTNAWTHVAGVYDGQSVRVYVNGAIAGTTWGDATAHTNAQPLRLGADSNGGSRFKGDLDEVSLYARALSGAEIKALYDEQVCQ
jgi:hypothetical protein